MATLFEQEIDLAAKAEPFIPFNLVLSGGIRYLVTGPDSIMVRETIIDHYPHASDRHNVLRMNQLAAIELLGPTYQHAKSGE